MTSPTTTEVGRARPILFSAPMVRALLAGAKTQTRRVIPEATVDAYYEYDDWCINMSAGVPHSRQREKAFFLERSRIQPGDRLWVREAWRTFDALDHIAPRDLIHGTDVSYEADHGSYSGRLRPSIHMPRWASRLTLTVTDVRVQRLQDISEEDARAEGVATFAEGRTMRSISDAEIYRVFWEEINGAGSWDENPWVAAYTFTVEHLNIDAPSPKEPQHDPS